MNQLGKDEGGASLGKWLTLSLLVLSSAGLAINGLLLFHHLTGAQIAGCGGGDACDEILNSRWSVVFGIPVAMLGMVVYAVLMVGVGMKNHRLVSVCLGGVLGAALWFVFVQAVMIGRFCPWCMAAHAVAVSLTVIGFWRVRIRGAAVGENSVMGVFAACTAVGIGALQFFGPLPVTHQLEDVSGASAASAADIHARGQGRKLMIDGERKVFNVDAMPHLGRSDAKHVLVEYFDYQCSGCQIMGGFLSSLMEKHPADICVVLLPVPLDHGCNKELPEADAGHPGSCALTRIALAVWRVDPSAFPELHWAFLSQAPLDEAAAMAMACEKIPAAQLEAAMRDPWSNELIQANIADWVSLSSKTRKLPKLLIAEKRILHGLPSGEADFIRVMEQELGL